MTLSIFFGTWSSLSIISLSSSPPQSPAHSQRPTRACSQAAYQKSSPVSKVRRATKCSGVAQPSRNAGVTAHKGPLPAGSNNVLWSRTHTLLPATGCCSNGTGSPSSRYVLGNMTPDGWHISEVWAKSIPPNESVKQLCWNLSSGFLFLSTAWVMSESSA